MTAATIAPDVDQLADVDWRYDPACESEYCAGDHGPATHRCVRLLCSCPPTLACTPCADDVGRPNDTVWQHSICGRCCAVNFLVRVCDLLRVEPLP